MQACSKSSTATQRPKRKIHRTGLIIALRRTMTLTSLFAKMHKTTSAHRGTFTNFRNRISSFSQIDKDQDACKAANSRPGLREESRAGFATPSVALRGMNVLLGTANTWREWDTMMAEASEEAIQSCADDMASLSLRPRRRSRKMSCAAPPASEGAQAMDSSHAENSFGSETPAAVGSDLGSVGDATAAGFEHGSHSRPALSAPVDSSEGCPDAARDPTNKNNNPPNAANEVSSSQAFPSTIRLADPHPHGSIQSDQDPSLSNLFPCEPSKPGPSPSDPAGALELELLAREGEVRLLTATLRQREDALRLKEDELALLRPRLRAQEHELQLLREASRRTSLST